MQRLENVSEVTRMGQVIDRKLGLSAARPLQQPEPPDMENSLTHGAMVGRGARGGVDPDVARFVKSLEEHGESVADEFIS